MILTKEKSILIIAPNLIGESLSLKLTSLDSNLNILLDNDNLKEPPDLIIWNVFNYQSEELIHIELTKLKARWSESNFLIIFSGNFKNDKSIPYINTEGLLVNPSVEKVLQSINLIIEGGRVFDLNNQNYIKESIKRKEATFSEKILSSGLKQIDKEIIYITKYLNNDLTPALYKFLLKGRLRELITAKSLLIFLWGNSLDVYTDQIFSYNPGNKLNTDTETIFIRDKNSLEIWDLIYSRLLNKYSEDGFNVELNNESIILSGLRKKYISKLICNILNELDGLIKNCISKDDYKIEFNSLLNELKKNTLANISDSYLTIRKNNSSIIIKEFITNEFKSIENNLESHNAITFFEPIIENKPLKVDGKILPIYEIETFKLLEAMISNWAIRTSNVLASEIFTLCSNMPELRNLFISKELQSTRSFERFRNNINNFNRWNNNIYIPIYLYESKREYIDIIDNKFVRYFRDENREDDLKDLDWLQKQVTLLVEIRDAIAPQLEIAVKYIGKIVVTILTKVVGKALGLIGKGILQGLGRSNSN